MSKKYLIVNTGSASKKYAIYDENGEVAFIHLETEESGYISTVRFSGNFEKVQITKDNFDKSLVYLLGVLKSKNIIADKKELSGIGIRVVAPGMFFQKNGIIDKEYLKKLEDAKKKAPLHLEMIFTEIQNLKKFFGNEIKIVGASDSEFHSTMLEKAKHYAIDSRDAEKHEIYRYGYHGISAASIVNKLKKSNNLPSKIIICHIGGGVSVMAVKDGKSIDTSMGFTPLEGMIMANRVGDIDSGAVVYLSEVLKLNGIKLLQYLNKKCGLFGLSNSLSGDVRDLFKAEEENKNTLATRALDIYAYKIQKQIGSYFVALGGLDMLVFSGTVGERSFRMRKRICKGLESLGIILDQDINDCTDGKDCIMSTGDSKVRIEVVKTDEMTQIAEETREII